MDYVDIRLCLFEHINNVTDLISLCMVDKLGIKTASSKAFWMKEFEKFKLPQPLIIFYDYHEWVKAFLQCKWAMNQTVNIINKVNLNELENIFTFTYLYLDKYINILKQGDCNYELHDEYINGDISNVKINTLYLYKSYTKSTYSLMSTPSINAYNCVNINSVDQLKNVLYCIYKENTLDI